MLGFVKKLHISVQLIFLLDHLLLLAELAQKFKLFKIALWQSDSVKRNFGGFIFIFAPIKADLWEATFFFTLTLCVAYRKCANAMQMSKKWKSCKQNAAIRECTLMSDIFSHYPCPTLCYNFYNTIPKPFMFHYLYNDMNKLCKVFKRQTINQHKPWTTEGPMFYALANKLKVS